MKKFLKNEKLRLIALLIIALVIICFAFIRIYSTQKELATVIFIPIELEIIKKIISTFFDTSSKTKLMNDAKLFHECGVITDEEFNEKRKYIRTLLEDIDYVERTIELPKNQNKKVDEQNNTLSTQLEDLKSENKDLREEINVIKQQNKEIIKLLKESNQKNDCVISRIAKKIKK